MPLTQSQFIDKIVDAMHLKNDAALSRQLNIVPPVISKVRHDTQKFGCTMAVRVSKLTGWTIEQIERDLGVTF